MSAIENLVREAMAERTQDLYLRADAGKRALGAIAARRRRNRRLALIAASSAAFVLLVAGIAAATGALPWVTREAAIQRAPFVVAPDPASLAGSTVQLAIPGPESSTFQIITATVTIPAGPEQCAAVAVKGDRGAAQHLMSSCGTPGAATPNAAAVAWQAPSGVAYVVVTGPATSKAATVALKTENGALSPTEPVRGGYYLVYAPAAGLPPAARLVFYDASGHVLREVGVDLAQHAAAAASP